MRLTFDLESTKMLKLFKLALIGYEFSTKNIYKKHQKNILYVTKQGLVITRSDYNKTEHEITVLWHHRSTFWNLMYRMYIYLQSNHRCINICFISIDHYSINRSMKSHILFYCNSLATGTVFQLSRILKSIMARKLKVWLHLWENFLAQSWDICWHKSPLLEFCVWGAVSSHSSHHPQEVLLAQFSL